MREIDILQLCNTETCTKIKIMTRILGDYVPVHIPREFLTYYIFI